MIEASAEMCEMSGRVSHKSPWNMSVAAKPFKTVYLIRHGVAVHNEAAGKSGGSVYSNWEFEDARCACAESVLARLEAAPVFIAATMHAGSLKLVLQEH